MTDVTCDGTGSKWWLRSSKPGCEAAEAELDVPALGDRQRQDVLGVDEEGVPACVPAEDDPLAQACELRA